MIRIAGDIAGIKVSGVQKKVSILLLDDVQVGDYLIVHAGYDIQKIDTAAALTALKALADVFPPEEGR